MDPRHCPITFYLQSLFLRLLLGYTYNGLNIKSGLGLRLGQMALKPGSVKT